MKQIVITDQTMIPCPYCDNVISVESIETESHACPLCNNCIQIFDSEDALNRFLNRSEWEQWLDANNEREDVLEYYMENRFLDDFCTIDEYLTQKKEDTTDAQK